MSSMTIAKTRDNLSSIVAGIERGDLAEHYIRNRNRIVAKIVPVEESQATSSRIGVSKEMPLLVDDEIFDALDAEIQEMFGV